MNFLVILAIVIFLLIIMFIFRSVNADAGNRLSEEELQEKSIEELQAIIDELTGDLSLGRSKTDKLPTSQRKYGCKTRGDADEFYDLVVGIHNNKLRSYQSQFEVLSNEDIEKLNNSTWKDIFDCSDGIVGAHTWALEGNVDVMLSIGLCYQHAIENEDKAFYWINRAANSDNVMATYILGSYYYNGYGIAEDRKKGFNLIVKSAKKDCQDAIEWLKSAGVSDEEMRSCGIPV